MKHTFLYILLVFSAQTALSQQFTLDDLFNYEYYPQSLQGGNSMMDDEHFTLLTRSGVQKFSYTTFDRVATIKSGSYSDYLITDDETWMLLESEVEPIFRRSKRAVYSLYHMQSGEEIVLFDAKKIQEPTVSPNGEMVAFVFENNLYIQDIKSLQVTQITKDGEAGKIINGVTDWVYEEEFAFVRAFDWNADSDKIAFIRFDETAVPEMDIDMYGSDLYPSELNFKYPKAGETNSTVSVHVYNVKTQKTTSLDLSAYEDFYVPKIKFSKKANDLMVLVANRHQNKIDVFQVNASSLKKTKLFTETDKAWIDTDNLTLEFLDDNSFLWNSERDGFRHIYHYDAKGKLINQVTQGDWEVTEYYGYNPKNNKIYYQSTEPGSINRGVYAIGLDGKGKVVLADKPGVNSATFSQGFGYFILNHDKANQVKKYTLNKGDKGQELAVLQDNARAAAYWNKVKPAPKEYEEIEVNGTKLNAYMIKPKDFDPNKKYPLFMYVYGGPGSQQVMNHADPFYYWWFQVLADEGYIVACVDNRGTGGKGADFKKVTYKDLGNYEIQDQIAAAKYYGGLPYIDAERIGIFGWSYGGYMTSLALTKGADTFKMGIAVAPVTNWRYYDTVYTERFLQTPQENPAGYDDNSPINYADLMKGNFLLVHGTADDNVHVQNAMQFAEALIQANKKFEYMVYPDKNHGIYGGNTRRHLFTKMTNFILENL